MKLNKQVKFSAFGHFYQIQPTPDIMSFFLEKYKKFNIMPSLLQEVKVDNHNSNSTNRMGFFNQDGSKKFVILSDRIDYELIYSTDTQLTNNKIDEIIDEIVEVFSILDEAYHLKYNRIAVNAETFLVYQDEKEFSEIIKRFTTPIDFLNNNEYDEWTLHTLVRKNVNLNDVSERCNIITNYTSSIFNKSNGSQVETNKGFVVHTDINTLSDNLVERFSHNVFRAFIEKAEEWMINSIEGL